MSDLTKEERDNLRKTTKLATTLRLLDMVDALETERDELHKSNQQLLAAFYGKGGHAEEFLAVKQERDRLRLVANDAKAWLDGQDAGSAAALSESVAAWERGESVDAEDIGK